MSLTKIGSIGINTGIQFAGVTTVSTLHVGSGVTLSSDGDGFYTGVVTATSFVGDGSGLTNAGPSLTGSTDNTIVTVTGANALQGETNLTFDGSILTVTGNVDLPDNTSGNASLRLGNSQDFYLNHNGTDSFIINNTGDLYIRDLNGDVHIQGKDNEESIIAKADGAVELYHDNSKKLETTSSGVTVTGAVNASSVTLGDNNKAFFGTGSDLQVYHDGSNSYVANTTGTLLLQSTATTTVKGTTVQFENAAGTEVLLKAVQDGAVELYHNNSKKFETSSTGASVSGNLDLSADNYKLRLGGGNDIEIYTDGSHSYLNNENGNWYIHGSTGSNSQEILIRPKQGEQSIRAIADGAVELYHDNGIRLTTTSTGINVTQAGSGSVSTFSHGGGAGGVRIAGPAASSGANLIFANNFNSSVSDEWAIQLNGSADDLTFLEGGAGGTERIRFLDTGGITFGGDTATANALNDYEEGIITFAPVNTGVSFSSTYKGRYTKIGELVTVSGYLVLSSHTGSGNTLNVQLPFTSAANSEGYYSRGVGATFARYMNFPANYQNMVAYVGGGEAYVRFFMTRNAGGSADWHQMTHNNITSNTAIYFNVCYTVVT